LENRSEGLSLWVDELLVDLENVRLDFKERGEEASNQRSFLRKVKDFFLAGEQEDWDPIAASCWFWKLLSERGKCGYSWERRKYDQPILGLYGLLTKRFGESTDQLFSEVFSAIGKRYRASSLVESLNSILRSHLFVHRGVTQGFLQLFMAYRNLKRPGCGKVRGPSPYEGLTGQQVDDWLTAIGYPPTA
jgi:IS1 family transposase